MNKRMLLIFLTLFTATLASAKVNAYSTNFLFYVMTPSPSYTVLNQTANAPWMHPPTCSQNICTYGISTDGNPYQFYVTIGKDLQHYCQLIVTTSGYPGFYQQIQVQGTSNCVGNMNYVSTYNDGFALHVMLFGPFNKK